MLAAFLGTCEFLFKTVGKVNTTSPALPIEIKRSTIVRRDSSEILQLDRLVWQSVLVFLLPGRILKGKTFSDCHNGQLRGLGS